MYQEISQTNEDLADFQALIKTGQKKKYNKIFLQCSKSQKTTVQNITLVVN